MPGRQPQIKPRAISMLMTRYNIAPFPAVSVSINTMLEGGGTNMIDPMN